MAAAPEAAAAVVVVRLLAFGPRREAPRVLQCILLEEWFRRIPEFRVKDGADTTVFPGLLSIRNLPLVWDVK